MMIPYDLYWLIFQMACYHSGLPAIIHKIWPWCQMEPQLMLSAVSLLSTYAAKCLTGMYKYVCTCTSYMYLKLACACRIENRDEKISLISAFKSDNNTVSFQNDI